MHVTSLPGPNGIGAMGKPAHRFVDFLEQAGQKYWQVLPLSPTGYGDSPYQSFSAFAGNHYLIDLELLVDEGLLRREEVEAVSWSGQEDRVDYGILYENRGPVLYKAYERFLGMPNRAFHQFIQRQQDWLQDYALFMAVKAEQEQAGLSDWPDDLRTREPAALAAAKERLAAEVDYYKAVQFFFYTQWNALKSYANSHGIQLVGDIPIYVSPDSSDLWTHPELFQTDGAVHLTSVAGCPPDAFAADGQLWATRSTTGPATRPKTSAGGSSASSTPLPSTTSSASTISGASRATTPSPPGTRPLRAVTGRKALTAPSSTPCTKRWARAASLPRIWAI